ncbi:MAG: hypothetical protein ACXACI_13095 [Candidatus Hodarchaeales archaeon]|jgi:hypothetical protein
MTSDISYQAGICNIGTPEINQRMRLGWLGLLLTALGFISILSGVAFYDIPPVIGFLVGLPAFMAAIGFLQAQQKFCVAYGLMHVQNVTPQLGAITAIRDVDNRKKDRNKAFRMILLAIAIGLATGILTFILAVTFSS